MPRFGDPEPLAAHHTLEGFDCGTASMNRWLLDHARQSAGAGSARTYVLVDADQERVVGYHALAAAAVSPAEATSRVRRGQLLVHALHEEARSSHERWGFERSPTD